MLCTGLVNNRLIGPIPPLSSTITLVSDAHPFHLFDLISSIPISNLQLSNDANCLVSHHPHSSDL
jgi:hypothetical protein